MKSIKVKDVMSAYPVMVKPTQTVMEAALLMKENNCSILPVGEPLHVIGVITDRDIIVRITAMSKDADKVPVKDVMSRKFVVCNEDDAIQRAEDLMRENYINRIMVSDSGAVTGIVTMTDLLHDRSIRYKGDTLLNRLLDWITKKYAVNQADTETEYQVYG